MLSCSLNNSAHLYLQGRETPPILTPAWGIWPRPILEEPIRLRSFIHLDECVPGLSCHERKLFLWKRMKNMCCSKKMSWTCSSKFYLQHRPPPVSFFRATLPWTHGLRKALPGSFRQSSRHQGRIVHPAAGMWKFHHGKRPSVKKHSISDKVYVIYV